MKTLIIAGVFSVCALAASAARPATFIVTNINDSGAGSLRQVIIDANAAAGFDTIEFNIAGAGVHTIFPTSPLPSLLNTTFVDGSSQPGFAGTPLIEIAGDSAGAGAVGLQIFNNSSVVGWLTINGFDSHGIHITGTGNTLIYGCWIGVNKTGDAASFPNGGDGIFIDNSPNNVIGGTTANLRNVISGNSGSGVRILGAGSTGNIIRGNYIGTNSAGNAALGNAFNGIFVHECAGNTIGGATAGSGNVVSGNVNISIFLLECPAAGNVIQGNYVGLNAAGNALLGVSGGGILVQRSPNTLVGGTTAGARNVIAGASLINLEVATASEGTVIQGNYIGTDSTGSAALGGGAGTFIFNVCDITIGGNTAASRNVISGNDGDGIFITGSSCITPNFVYGNYIGVAANGTSPLGNGGSGVHISFITNNRIGNTIGGSNVIAHNTGAGIFIDNDAFLGPPFSGNYISANSIHSNGELGIDLSANPSTTDGVTLNDPGDVDTGANEFQNFPIISSARTDGTFLNITLVFSGTPSNPYSIEIFANDSCDHFGHGEGRRLVGVLPFTTDGFGNWAFSGVEATFTFPVGSDEFITATITDVALANTSEFSPCFSVTSDACGSSLDGSCFASAGNGTPGCESGDCCNAVCDVDPYCCDSEWDPLCAVQAPEICGNSGHDRSGDCFTPNPTSGCYDLVCVAIVCEVDPFCCLTEWDSLCSSAALSMCAAPCPGDIPFISPGVVNVTDLLFLLSSWGITGPPRPRADLAPPPTGDNQVNVTDLLALLAGWGTCP